MAFMPLVSMYFEPYEGVGGVFLLHPLLWIYVSYLPFVPLSHALGCN